MANKIEKKQFESWKEVIVDFLDSKRNAEEEKYLKDIIKNIGEKFKEHNYFNNDEIHFLFDSKKRKMKAL